MPVGTNYAKPASRPDGDGKFEKFGRLVWWVSNAKQAAQWYCTHMGFVPFAYSGLETGNREYAAHVITQGGHFENKDWRIMFEFRSALQPHTSTCNEFTSAIGRHGDFVKDVAFVCQDLEKIMAVLRRKGAKIIKDIHEMKDDEGTVRCAVISTYGDVQHTLLDRSNYTGKYLPGYKEPAFVPQHLEKMPDCGLLFVDHVVGNQPEIQMENVADWYSDNLMFHRFWSVDDSQMHTDISALRSVVMTNFDETIKMPINEPAEKFIFQVHETGPNLGKFKYDADGNKIHKLNSKGEKLMGKSQIQEYCDYNDGAGVQHIAIRSADIISSIRAMKKRGCEFLLPPKSYYRDLKTRLAAPDAVKVVEDLADIEECGILIDFDDKGYLLQLFTKPVQDRPTLFIEIIQRRNHEGFGAGNFKALFESIQADQLSRGNVFNE